MRPTDINQKSQVTFGSIANAAQMGVGLLVLVLISHIVTPAELGLYFFMLSIVKISDGPLTGAVGAATKRYSEVDAPREELVGLVLLLVVGLSVIFAVITHLLALVTVQIAHPGLMSVLFAGLLSSKSLLTLYTGTGLIGRKTLIEFGRSTVRGGIWIVAGLLGLGATGLVAGTVIASLLSVPIVLVLLGRNLAVPSRETVASVWDFARYSSLSDIVYKTMNHVDPVIIGVLIGPATVASYEVTLRLTTPALLMTSVIAPSLLSRVSDLDSRNEPVADEVLKTLSFASLLAVPVFFGALSLGGVLVATPFGSDYTGLGSVLILMALYRAIQSQTSPLASAISGLDMPRSKLEIATVGALVNALISIWGALEFGLIGVVFGTVVASFTKWGLFGGLFYKVTGSTPVPSSVRNQVFSGAIMAALLWITRGTFGIDGWTEVVLYVVFGGVVYFASVLLTDGAVREVAIEFSEPVRQLI